VRSLLLGYLVFPVLVDLDQRIQEPDLVPGLLEAFVGAFRPEAGITVGDDLFISRQILASSVSRTSRMSMPADPLSAMALNSSMDISPGLGFEI
jgi:hypothetical protein